MSGTTLDLDKTIGAEAFDMAYVRAILRSAAVEFDAANPEIAYVLGFAFNFWIMLLGDGHTLAFQSHWSMAEDVDDDAALEFVNDLNASAVMAQFFYDVPSGLLRGHYALMLHDGLLPRQLLRAGGIFAGNFRAAVVEGCALGLMKSLVPEPGGITGEIVTIN